MERRGITIGNYINIDMPGRINKDNIIDYVKDDQLFMHEYGHYIQSQRWGPLFLLAVGLPSLVSASFDRRIPNDPYNASTHDYFWTEYHANRNAARYFYLYYGTTWDEKKGYPFYDYRRF